MSIAQMDLLTPQMDQRKEAVNRIVAAMARRGRNFFKGKRDGKEDGHFILRNGKVYWFEEYNQRPMRPIERNRHLCNHGRTLWYQLLAFTRFIEHGQQGYIYSEYWGYPKEDVDAIHALAAEVGYLAPEEE